MIRRADSSGLVVRRMGALRPALTWPPKQAAPTWRVSKKMIRRCGAAFPLAGLLLSDRKHTGADLLAVVRSRSCAMMPD
jgi:hypothetical protein